MQKAEPQQKHAQNQPAQRSGGNAALESPQGEQIAQLEAMANASSQAGRLAQLTAMANNSPGMAAQRKAISAIHKSPNITAQRQQIDTLSGETAQREETEEPLQPKVAQREETPTKPNNTGLPDNLKSGIESLSGMSMDNVKVHYNSSQPAQLNALAYAQGADIHVAPGQEQHLPHEAWHVVQQAQGRVKPTMQMKDDVPVNDDKSLEHEADVMGARAGQMVLGQNARPVPQRKTKEGIDQNDGKSNAPVIQRFFTPEVIAGYTAAAAHWTQATAAVTAFDAALNARGIAHGANVKTALLNTNATHKANKAKGTLSGEAFEPLHWNEAAYPSVDGPGAANGIDIINYDLTAVAGETDVREVKSALTQNSAFSVINTAWQANPIILSEVELYYQGAFADFNLVNLPINPAVAAFSRAGSDYYRVAGPVRDLTVNVRNPVGGAIIHTVFFDVF